MSVISPASTFSPSSTSTGASAVQPKSMSQQDFLKVLVAQITHQDPTTPQTGTDFYKNIMDLSNYQAIQDVSGKMNSINSGALVGKTVTADDGSGNHASGTVTAANYDTTAGTWSFTVGGKQFTAAQIIGITQPAATTAAATTPATGG